MSLFNFSYNKKRLIIKKDPEIILEAPVEWKQNKEEFEKLTLEAISFKPDIIFKLVGRKDFKLCKEYMMVAINSYPKILIEILVKRNDIEEQNKKNKKQKNIYDDMLKLVSDEMFIDAIIKDPSIIAIKKSEIKNFNSKYDASKITKNEDGEEIVKFKMSLRDQILYALRLIYGVSDDEMATDLVKSILSKAKNNKNFLKSTKNDTIIENVPTVARALIKNKDKKVTKFTDKALSGHNYRIAYELMDLYASNLEEYKDDIANMPIREFDKKIIKKLIIRAIKKQPEVYYLLDELGFGEYKDDSTVKYNTFKAMKFKGYIYSASDFSQEEIKKFNARIKAAYTRNQNKLNKSTEEVETK